MVQKNIDVYFENGSKPALFLNVNSFKMKRSLRINYYER